MLTTSKIARDRARAEQSAAYGTNQNGMRSRPGSSRPTSGRPGSSRPNERSKKPEKMPSAESAKAFRAKQEAAAMFARPTLRGSALSETRRKRTSVVAIVKKRVDMLHMNVISREFAQVLGEEDETRLALARKEGQARKTWGEICTIPDFNGDVPQAFANPGGAADTDDKDESDSWNDEDTDLPSGTRFLVHPHAQKKVKWDLMVAILIVYSTLVVPFRIGFDQAADLFGAIVDIVVDIVFALDIVASFRTAFVDENGETVVDTKEIGKRYLKAWFAIDFLSTVPVDQVALYFAGQGRSNVLRSTKMLRILRLARLFKLVRLFKLQSKVIGGEDSADKMNPSVVSLLKMLMYMTYIAHIMGCLWHWLVTFEDNGITWVSHFGVDEASVATKYVTSIYWAFTTMTTVGYGDVIVTSTLEMSFCILGMLVGATVFGYIVGNVSVMMESFDMQSALRTEKMDRVKEYIISRRFPQKFSRRVINQYKYHYKRVSVLDNYAILDGLPTTARTSLLFAQYHDAVDQLSFLQNNPPIFVTRLVGCLTASYAKPGDVLFFQEEVGSDLYFVVTGKVNLYVTFNAVPAVEKIFGASYGTGVSEVDASTYDGIFARQTFTLAKVFKDSKVGEAGVMLDVQQPCAAVAMAVCDLFTVGKEDLLAALDGYMEVQAALINEAEEFMKRLETFKKKKGAEPGADEGTAELPLSAAQHARKSSCTPSANSNVRDGDDTGHGKILMNGDTEAARIAMPPLSTQPSFMQSSASRGTATEVSPVVRRTRSGYSSIDGDGGNQPALPNSCSTIKLSAVAELGSVGEGSGPRLLGSGGSGSGGGGGGGAGVCSGGDQAARISLAAAGSGGLSVASISGRDNAGGKDDLCGLNDDDSDDDDPAYIHPVADRGRFRRSMVSQQLMDLADAAASDVAAGSAAHTNLINRMNIARRFRKGSKRVLPTEGSTYQAALKRTASGASEKFEKMTAASYRGTRNSDSGSTSTASSRGTGGGYKRKVDLDVGNLKDLEAFNSGGDVNMGGNRGTGDASAEGHPTSDQLLGDGFRRHPEPALTAAGTASCVAAPKGVGEGSDSDMRSTMSPASPSGERGGASVAGGSSLDAVAGQAATENGQGPHARVEEQKPVKLAALGWKGAALAVRQQQPSPHAIPNITRVNSYGVGGSRTAGRSALRSSGHFNRQPSTPYRHTPMQSAFDNMSEVGEVEPVEHRKKKNMNFMNVHQGTQRQIDMRMMTVQQLALNELSPHMFWGRLHVIHPDSIGKAGWDVFVAFFIVFSVVEVTFRLGFDAAAEGSWGVFNYVVDVIFLIDMALSFDTAFWDDGNIITERRDIASNYIKSWFLVDIVSTVPLDALFSTLVKNSEALRGTKLIRMIRLIRLFKIFRLLKMSTFFERYEEAMPANPSVIRLTKLVVLMSFAAHLAACVWYAVGIQSIHRGRNSWILDHCISDGVYSSCLGDQPLGAKYMASVYWAFTTMTTVGYGDITPANNVPEMMTAVVSQVAGTTLFAYVIGALVNIVLNLDPQTRLRKQKVEYLSEYMRDFNMTQGQKTEMRRHFNFKLSFNSVFPEMDILAVLPPYLRIPAVLYSYRAALPRLPLLCQIEMTYPGFLAVLLPRLKPGEYVKGDLIVSPRLCAQEMGFVLHGICEGKSAGTGEMIQIYREGQYLGHATLLVPEGVSFKVLVEVRAVMRVEMLMLHKPDFDWLLTYYPPPMERLRDELTDWAQVLQWISLPKVYAKKIRRIVQRTASIEGRGGTSGAGTTSQASAVANVAAVSPTSVARSAVAASAAAASAAATAAAAAVNMVTSQAPSLMRSFGTAPDTVPLQSTASSERKESATTKGGGDVRWTKGEQQGRDDRGTDAAVRAGGESPLHHGGNGDTSSSASDPKREAFRDKRGTSPAGAEPVKSIGDDRSSGSGSDDRTHTVSHTAPSDGVKAEEDLDFMPSSSNPGTSAGSRPRQRLSST